MSLHADDGSINITEVDGTTRTGLYAADGSLNVFQPDGSAPVGAMHPCGALNVTVVTNEMVGRYAADGSVHVCVSPYASTGALKVTGTLA